MTCKNKSFMTKRKAFTLIELLIVIAIIGILFIVLVSKVDFATDKAKATGVQTDFRSFQLAFDTVAKENTGFNTFGWDTGDANQNGKRDSYDECDTNKDGIQNGTEVFTGHKVYAETFTKVYSLKKNGTGSYDRDALNRLETAINANLDPKLHITIKDDGEIVMANGAQDPWNKEYHGWYITNAEVDKKDRGAIVMYSDGANNEFGSEHTIANGVVKIIVPGNNKAGKDDYSIVSVYTYVNGYGEVKNVTTGFSNNQNMLGGNGLDNNNVVVNPENPSMPDVDEPNIPETPTAADPYQEHVPGLYQSGSNYTVLLKSWDDMVADGTIMGNVIWKNHDSLDGDMLMPRDMTRVSNGVFYGCTKLRSVVLPYNCIEIGTEAFNQCSSLETVIMFDKVQKLASFSNSQVSIDKVVYYGTLKQWCEISGHHSYLYGTNYFYVNENELIQNLDFSQHPEITKISSGAFRGYNGLKSVIISEQIDTTDSTYVFSECYNLSDVTINTDINGQSWFENCSNSLKNVYLNANLNANSTFSSCFHITNLYLDKSCTNFGNNTFLIAGVDNCYYNGTIDDYLKVVFNNEKSNPTYWYQGKLYIQNQLLENLEVDHIDKINDYAFAGLVQLKTVSISSSVKSIGKHAFYGCNKITSITLSDGLEYVYANAFYDCTSAVINMLPTSLKRIDESAFSGCTQRLGDLVIGNNVESIGKSAFYNWQVTSITIGDSVKSISSRAFNECTKVTNILIGSGIETIEAEAFLDLRNLQSVTIYASMPPTMLNAFSGCTNIQAIYVPAESVDLYKTTDGWSQFADIIQAIE